jgi:hypothetical protein
MVMTLDQHGLYDRDHGAQYFADEPAAHRIQQLLDSRTRVPLLPIFPKKCSPGIRAVVPMAALEEARIVARVQHGGVGGLNRKD